MALWLANKIHWSRNNFVLVTYNDIYKRRSISDKRPAVFTVVEKASIHPSLTRKTFVNFLKLHCTHFYCWMLITSTEIKSVLNAGISHTLFLWSVKCIMHTFLLSLVNMIGKLWWFIYWLIVSFSDYWSTIVFWSFFFYLDQIVCLSPKWGV